MVRLMVRLGLGVRWMKIFNITRSKVNTERQSYTFNTISGPTLTEGQCHFRDSREALLFVRYLRGASSYFAHKKRTYIPVIEEKTKTYG